MSNTFSKAERLNSKKIIDKLFEKGSVKTKSVFLYPFRVVYLPQNNDENNVISIIISVSKRSFKKAVNRNTIKRRIREAYRLNKNLINTSKPSILPAHIAFIYIGKEILPYAIIESKIKEVLKMIVVELNTDI